MGKVQKPRPAKARKGYGNLRPVGWVKMEKIVSDIGSDLLGEVYRFEVKRRGTRTQQIAPRYTQGLHFNAQAVESH